MKRSCFIASSLQMLFILFVSCIIVQAPLAAETSPVSWRAQWVGEQQNLSGEDAIAIPKPVYLSRCFRLSSRVKKATAYISAHGLYHVSLNGKEVTRDVLTPGWTSYNKRIQFQEYDVTSLLKKGENAVMATVAPGWYSGGLNWGNPAKRFMYGKDVALLLQLEIELSDGTRQVITTDDSWNLAHGRVTFANIYDGQVIDNTLPECGNITEWVRPGYVSAVDPSQLVPSISEPVRRRTALAPKAMITTPRGERVVDFGQNISGWEHLTVKGNRGDTLRIRHAEVLDKDGNFYTKNLRDAKAEGKYILSGGVDEFEPVFTFFGFRYISLELIPSCNAQGECADNPRDGSWDLSSFGILSLEAVPVSSSFDDIAHFSCSDPLINQLHSNIKWGFRDNFIDVPTDCPQRDERLGWTGDAQVFFRTATFLGDVNKFFRKWLADVSADQRPDGRIPRVIPDTFPNSRSRLGSAGWADCCTFIPWQHYMAYGDASVLLDQYECMKSWCDWCLEQTGREDYLLNKQLNHHFGDWLFWSKEYDPDGQSAVTSKALIAQAYFCESLRILYRSAEILYKENRSEGFKADALHYSQEYSKALEAFRREYITPSGAMMSDTQTAYVLALHFGLMPDHLRDQAAKRLVDNIRLYKNHITTGFLGTPYICHVLTDCGYSDVAYDLLMQKSCPSWIYPVEHGATTIWERWNSIQTDGSIIEGMNSFNHYSFGAIGDWLYRCALGIRETSPGYATLEINPHAGGGITHMEGGTRTPHGRVDVKWTADENGDMKTLEVEVPAGVEATVLFDGRRVLVKGGKHLFKAQPRTTDPAVDWNARRSEILDMFQCEVYGKYPAQPDTLLTEVLDQANTLGRMASRKQIRMWFTKDKSGPYVDWLVVTPRYCGAKVPAIMMLNYYGNHSILADEKVLVPDCWLENEGDLIRNNRAQESKRGYLSQHLDRRSVVPLDEIIARGYAFVTACYGQVSADPDNKAVQDSIARGGVFDLWRAQGSYRDDDPHATGSLMAWAWALSRGMDMVEQMDSLDASRLVVTGSSRLGKAAMLASAFDTRFQTAVVNQAGGGGVQLFKDGRGESAADLVNKYPHWFCSEFRKYVGKESDMPFDQHLLVGCIAPRRLLVEGFNYEWFDTIGEFECLQMASEAWKQLGKDGLPDVEFPDIYDTRAIGVNLGYVRRNHGHGLAMADWQWLFKFASKVY